MFNRAIPKSLPSCSELVISSRAGDYVDDPTVQVLADGLGHMDRAWRQITKARDAHLANKMETHPRNLKNANEFATRAHTQATRAATAAYHQGLNDSKARMAEIMKPLEKGANGPQASEIRALARTFSAEKRGAFIAEAIKAGDVTTAAALLAANPQLSGLTREGQQAYLNQWLRTQHTAIMARLDVLQMGLEALERGGAVFNSAVANLTADPEVKRAELSARAAHDASKLPA